MLRPTSRVLAAQDGFTGAEKALLVCVALALVVVIGQMLGGGSQQAAGDAQRTLFTGAGSPSAGGALGSVLSAGGLPRADGVRGAAAMGQAGAATPGQAGAAASGRAGAAAMGQAATGATPLQDGKQDTAYDGALVGAGGAAYPGSTPLDQVPPVLPAGGVKNGELIIEVNGIGDTKASQYGSLQAVANATGEPVLGIHNATQGAVVDIAQSAEDKLDIGKNPAVDEVASEVYQHIQAGQPIHLMGHSQGALIISRALSEVSARLQIEDGLTKAQAEQRLSLVKVETYGGAATSYPDGPQYVHYVNRADVVPGAFGLGPTENTLHVGPLFNIPLPPLPWDHNPGAGAGAKVIRFNDVGSPGYAHSLTTYLKHRVPFDQARQ